jgi:hypothetical protein
MRYVGLLLLIFFAQSQLLAAEKKTFPFAKEAQKHWAFQGLKKSTNSKNSVDYFILNKIREHQLKISPKASKEVLLRRVSFNLIGLPPTTKDLNNFLNDNSPQAFKNVIERLLASKHYGERWGRYWLDLAHYADTQGDSGDFPIYQAHKYRDYVIDAYNNDKPYDQFLQEQIAGDLLAKKDPTNYSEKIIATGFLASALRFSVRVSKHKNLVIEDNIDTLSKSLLGLNIGCARCHDHKSNPISQKDYYALYGIFNSSRYSSAGCETYRQPQDLVSIYPKNNAAIKELEDVSYKIDKIFMKNPKFAAYGKDFQAYFQAQYNKNKVKVSKEESASDLKKVHLLYNKLHRLNAQHMAYAVVDNDIIADSKMHLKGNKHNLGQKVKRGFPQFLNFGFKNSIDKNESGRLQLAQWITDKRNPLTARVMVNRIWQNHFGKGLVDSPNNFGLKGSTASHPQLLDYLAAEFMKNNWSIKHMHRMILLTKTYQRSSKNLNAKNDQSNIYLSYYSRRRLDAEAIRDSLLTASHELDLSTGIQHPFPELKKLRAYTQHVPFQEIYSHKHRSVYLMVPRFHRHPYLTLFDGPDSSKSTAKRSNSTVPVQSLFFMNSTFVNERAEQAAKKIMADTSITHDKHVEKLYLQFFTRKASKQELEMSKNFRKAHLKQSNSPLKAWKSYVKTLLSTNEFVYID